MSTAGKRILATSINLWAIQPRLRSAIIIASVGTLVVMFYPSKSSYKGVQSTYTGSTSPATLQPTTSTVNQVIPALKLTPSIKAGTVDSTATPLKPSTREFGTISEDDVETLKNAPSSGVKPSFSLE
jgi:hypothetical protein